MKSASAAAATVIEPATIQPKSSRSTTTFTPPKKYRNARYGKSAVATSSPCPTRAAHLPRTIRVAESRVSRTRSRLLATRSPLTAVRPRSGTTTTIASASAPQNIAWKSRPEAPSGAPPNVPTAQVMRANIAPWMPMNVQAKIPDCTPCRSSRTSIGDSQPGKSSPRQVQVQGRTAGARRAGTTTARRAAATASPRTSLPPAASSRSQGRATTASTTLITARAAVVKVGAMFCITATVFVATRAQPAASGNGSVTSRPIA